MSSTNVKIGTTSCHLQCHCGTKKGQTVVPIQQYFFHNILLVNVCFVFFSVEWKKDYKCIKRESITLPVNKHKYCGNKHKSKQRAASDDDISSTVL